MNRKKKINSILKKRLKQQNSKLHKSNKPKYISKAERAKLESEENVTNDTTSNEAPELNEQKSEQN